MVYPATDGHHIQVLTYGNFFLGVAEYG